MRKRDVSFYTKTKEITARHLTDEGSFDFMKFANGFSLLRQYLISDPERVLYIARILRWYTDELPYFYDHFYKKNVVKHDKATSICTTIGRYDYTGTYLSGRYYDVIAVLEQWRRGYLDLDAARIPDSQIKDGENNNEREEAPDYMFVDLQDCHEALPLLMATYGREERREMLELNDITGMPGSECKDTHEYDVRELLWRIDKFGILWRFNAIAREAWKELRCGYNLADHLYRKDFCIDYYSTFGREPCDTPRKFLRDFVDFLILRRPDKRIKPHREEYMEETDYLSQEHCGYVAEHLWGRRPRPVTPRSLEPVALTEAERYRAAAAAEKARPG